MVFELQNFRGGVEDKVKEREVVNRFTSEREIRAKVLQYVCSLVVSMTYGMTETLIHIPITNNSVDSLNPIDTFLNNYQTKVLHHARPYV